MLTWYRYDTKIPYVEHFISFKKVELSLGMACIEFPQRLVACMFHCKESQSVNSLANYNSVSMVLAQVVSEKSIILKVTLDMCQIMQIYIYIWRCTYVYQINQSINQYIYTCQIYIFIYILIH